MSAFIDLYEAETLRRLGAISADSDVANWLTWARSHADMLIRESMTDLPGRRELPTEEHLDRDDQPQLPRPKSYWETRQPWQRR